MSELVVGRIEFGPRNPNGIFTGPDLESVRRQMREHDKHTLTLRATTMPNLPSVETDLNAFLPEELTGGWFQDILIGRVKEYLRTQWQAVKDAISNGDLSKLDGIVNQISEVIAGALNNRVSAKSITAFILAGGELWAEWVKSGLIRVASGVATVAAKIHDDLGAYMEDVQAILFTTAAPAEPNPEFGFMEVIAIGGFLLNLFRTWRERRQK